MSVSAGSQAVLKADFLSAGQSASNHYLAVSKGYVQPLCGNSEGWGPLSPDRFDFTPCFLDVWSASVAVFGITFGVGAIWYLYRKCVPQPVKKNWHFWAKLVGASILWKISIMFANLPLLDCHRCPCNHYDPPSNLPGSTSRLAIHW